MGVTEWSRPSFRDWGAGGAILPGCGRGHRSVTEPLRVKEDKWVIRPAVVVQSPLTGGFSSGQPRKAPRGQWILELAQLVAAVAAPLGSHGSTN